ncbi:hypothetical protein B0E38_06466 [Streptomyces sp. 111WW2]|uniref:hypothetical protein n=1 Tax=Streptomyces sp. 111WW2 TaxID=1945515 RepID=UPI000D2D86E4|nr:hypothetical protein [Streptomyces sp. 111WW2]PSK47989.1 hypothetical protein B0E38_06466 [Streptomyces sp. 111WW2]
MGRDFPAQITDGNGDTWEPAAGPGRNGEPVYYPTTGLETPAETPSEIEANYGIRR